MALVSIAVFLQAPGRIIPETKLDLVVDPVAFLERATHLWDSHGGFGQLQNQVAGYLLPMGPVFAAGHGLAVPMWIVQRLWIAVLISFAGIGVYRLARAMGIGTPATAWVAAMSYALAPALVGLVAFQSAGEIAYVCAPWALLPLVTGWQRGTPRTAAARSGVAVALAGGVNATAVAAVLVLPAAWILMRPAGALRRRFLGWWIASVALATAWWVVPLLLQSRYGFDFAPYSETSALTTSTMSAEEVLRGTGNWLGYQATLAGHWLPGAWQLVSSVVVIVCASMVTALGIAGLAHRRLPDRRPLVVAACIGIVVMAAGYGGTLSGFASPAFRDLLDGGLAPARNVFKLQPLLRLPLALGLAHALALLIEAPARAVLARRAVVIALSFVLVVGGAAPLFTGTLAAPGSFAAIPTYWGEVATWLDGHAGDGRSLLLPGAAFAEDVWGRPLDEPLGALMSGEWAVRDLIPLGGVGITRLLDVVDDVLVAGRGSPGLAGLLGRSGVRYVVVRNDLDPTRTNGPSAAVVHRVLAASPGISLAASFGPALFSASASGAVEPDVAANHDGRRAVEVYAVGGSAGRVASLPSGGGLVMSGGPDSLLQLADRGLLEGRATIAAGDDPAGSTFARWVASDTLRRRDVDFRVVYDNQSYALGADESAPGGGAARDRLAVEGAEHQAVIVLRGAQAIRASSYAEGQRRFPSAQPAAAFDGDPESAWEPAWQQGIEGEWLELDLGHTLTPSFLTVTRTAPRGSSDGQITALDVATEGGRVRADFGDADEINVPLPAGPTTWLRLTVAAARGGGVGIDAGGLAEVSVPGVEIERYLATPDDSPSDGGGPPETVVAVDRRVADPYDPSRRDEDPVLSRLVSLPEGGRFGITGTAVPVPGDALNGLVASAPATGSPVVTVTASSSWYDRPVFAAPAAFDGEAATAWVSNPDDPHPAITIHWDGMATVDRLRVVGAGGPTEPIRTVLVRSPGGHAATGELATDGTTSFPPVTTDELTVEFPRAIVPGAGGVTHRPVGVAELEIPVLAGRTASRPDPSSPFHLGCGEGPSIEIDGRPVELAVSGLVGDLIALNPLEVSSCSGPSELAAGTHTVVSRAGGAVRVLGLTLSTGDGLPIDASRGASVVTWTPEHRVVRVAAGAASYLAVTENFNDGWTATLDGQRLDAVRLDGWRQAFAVPAGAGGEVKMTYAPGVTYRRALLLGGALLVLLVALALVPARPVPTSAARLADEGTDRRSWLGLALTVVAVGLIGGPLAVFVGVLLLLPDRRRMLPVVAGAALLLAGLSVAFDPGRLPSSGAGAFGATAQLLAVLAVAALALSATSWVSNRSRSR